VPGSPEALEPITVDPPTIRVHFAINTSPFAGREGKFVTSRQIGDRLEREALSNPSVRIEGTGARDTFEVAGRGELQLRLQFLAILRAALEI
jgi:GTP-binding protein